ncbi:MAG: AAA domain-containing protein [Euryarchaeota archaeon]|nr:AAA domain-containing protein [Euryarchaeota archaeon]
MSSSQALFPFTSIVGQEDMKRALLLNIIDPGIGGVLIRGEKGTAKSTAVRSLVQILPEREVMKNCIFRCEYARPEKACSSCNERLASGEEIDSINVPMVVVELPLSATEDRVAGTLDIEYALKTGKKRFEPGILAQANGNILYIDEVNLLDDHLVDLLLDSAAMGVNYVEREGVSFSHPSRFILIGTMNPEEGDLRPQLLDRFGLSVDVEGEADIEDKIEIIKRRLTFDRDPERYVNDCQPDMNALRKKIAHAKNIINQIALDDDAINIVVKLTTHFGITGHRADITLMKAARANAALEGRIEVTLEDLRIVSALVLSHRMKRRPFEGLCLDADELEKCLQVG